MFSAKTRAAVALILTFVLGGLAGIAVDKSFGRRFGRPRDPRRASEHFAGLLEKRLELTADQKQRVQAIMLRFGEENETLFRETQPRIRALMAKSDRDIEAVLTPGQRKKFEAFRRERDLKRPFH